MTRWYLGRTGTPAPITRSRLRISAGTKVTSNLPDSRSLILPPSCAKAWANQACTYPGCSLRASASSRSARIRSRSAVESTSELRACSRTISASPSPTFASMTRSELGLHVRLVAVPDRLQQQVPKFPAGQHVTQDVEHLVLAEGVPHLRQLVEQSAVDLALAGLVGDQVPHVADLGLADAVHPSEPLLDPVRVPRQVVVDQQVGALEVDALARGVGRDEDQAVLVLGEPLLDDPTLLADHSAVDGHDGFGSAEVGAQLADEVVERVPVLGEHDQLPP